MPDVVTASKRRQMMSGIKSRDTKPELLIRRGLHQRGFRYRCNVSNLPGKPDIVLAKYRAVVLVHGCLWHQHECHLFKWPCADDPVKAEFWKKKITGNRSRDQRQLFELISRGWRVAVVWECALKGKHRIATNDLLKQLGNFVLSSTGVFEITGIKTTHSVYEIPQL